MLARRGYDVDVFDALPAPPPASDPAWGAGERSYQLGLNGRGQTALRALGCMDRIDGYAASVNGRLSFTSGEAEGGQAFTETRLKPPGTPGAEKTYVTRVMQRDRLQACLLEEVAEKYHNIRVTHGVSCIGVDLHGERPELELRPCEPVAAPEGEPEGCEVQAEGARTAAYDLVIGADGVQSGVRDSLCGAAGSATRTVRFEDTNERRYKTIPFHPSAVDGTPTDLNWGAREPINHRSSAAALTPARSPLCPIMGSAPHPPVANSPPPPPSGLIATALTAVLSTAQDTRTRASSSAWTRCPPRRARW